MNYIFGVENMALTIINPTPRILNKSKPKISTEAIASAYFRR